MNIRVFGTMYPVFLRFIILFIPLALFYVSGAVYMHLSAVELELANIRASEKASLYIGVSSINHQFQSAIGDVRFLSQQEGLLKLMEDSDVEGHDHLIKNWLLFSKIREVYDQIRWIDAQGMERERVNYNSGLPTSVAENNLQDKSTRYYFTDAVKLNREEIFISPFDLNIEGGKIEQPLKPMIRIGIPAFNRKGEKQGIVLINYLGRHLLNQYSRAMGDASPRSWLLNSDGFWLKGPTTDVEWGFMYQDNTVSMSHRYPGAWQHILSGNQGQFEDSDGLWSFISVYPISGIEDNTSSLHITAAPTLVEHMKSEYFWKAVLFLPNDIYLATKSRSAIRLVVASSLVLFVLFIGCWVLARTWEKHLNAEKEIFRINRGLKNEIEQQTLDLKEAKKVAEEQARTDPLTGMKNRRAFFEHGQANDARAKRHKHIYSVIMMDIDWFKKINDSYGHSVGDQVLKLVAETILKTARKSDISARVGGEEFAIILPETEVKRALEIAERLRLGIKNIIIPVEGKNLVITSSFGVTECLDEEPTINKVLGQADSALYQAKRQGRNRVVLFQAGPDLSKAD